MNFCKACGKEIDSRAAICPHCGVAVKALGSIGKSKIVAALLAFFLGWLGVHRFYLNDQKIGILYLGGTIVSWVFVILGLVLVLIPGITVILWFLASLIGLAIVIGALAETVVFLMMSDEEFDARYNQKD